MTWARRRTGGLGEQAIEGRWTLRHEGRRPRTATIPRPWLFSKVPFESIVTTKSCTAD
jgi:hypothetical protein